MKLDPAMKIALGEDSAGAPLLRVILQHLQSGPDVDASDLTGAPDGRAEPYPQIAARVALKALSGECERGILFCGTGIGMCISADKAPGIRAALTHDTYSAERARKSNNAQIIAMGARVIGPELAKYILPMPCSAANLVRPATPPGTSRPSTLSTSGSLANKRLE